MRNEMKHVQGQFSTPRDVRVSGVGELALAYASFHFASYRAMPTSPDLHCFIRTLYQVCRSLACFVLQCF